MSDVEGAPARARREAGVTEFRFEYRKQDLPYHPNVRGMATVGGKVFRFQYVVDESFLESKDRVEVLDWLMKKASAELRQALS